MASKVNVGALRVAILIGAGIGLLLGLVLPMVGLPGKAAGPLAGAVTGGLVPVIYGIRTKPKP
jgi:hypothetical protein